MENKPENFISEYISEEQLELFPEEKPPLCTECGDPAKILYWFDPQVVDETDGESTWEYLGRAYYCEDCSRGLNILPEATL